MAKISRIAAHQIVIPLEMPLRVGGYSISQREYCLIEITTDKGHAGHALAFTRGADLSSAIVDHIAPRLLGDDPSQIERHWGTAYQQTRLIGRQGLIMRALSLTDIALWDLKAKSVGAPLYQILGGARVSVPVLMAGGYYAENKGIPELIAEFQNYLADGYRHLKLMVGGESMATDLQRYIALRKSLPVEISLGVDVNGSWKSPKAALTWIDQAQQTTGLPISFLEEPLPPEQLTDTSFIRERTNVPLAIGEFLAGRWEFHRWLQGASIDIMRADATLCGGITEWRRIAALADTWSLPQIPHYFPSIHLHLALAFPGCEQIEVVSERGLNSSEHLITGRSYRISNGLAYPVDAPGLGLTISRDALDRYSTSSRTIEK